MCYTVDKMWVKEAIPPVACLSLITHQQETALSVWYTCFYRLEHFQLLPCHVSNPLYSLPLTFFFIVDTLCCLLSKPGFEDFAEGLPPMPFYCTYHVPTRNYRHYYCLRF